LISALRAHDRVGTVLELEADGLISRDELTAMLFAIADVNANVRAIRKLMEEELGGEEDLPEDDV
jgi:hypothetical protein